jgi:hypothetical protein
MLTIVLSGPARNLGHVHEQLVRAGATVVAEQDRALHGLPDWPEDAAQVVEWFRAVACAADLDGDGETTEACLHAADEWAGIAQTRDGVDVDWIECTIPDEQLDDVQAAVPRWGWLVRMHGPAQPVGPAVGAADAMTEALVAQAEARVLAQLRAKGVIQ